MDELEKSKRRLINEFQRRKNGYIATYKKIKRLVETAAGKTVDDATKEKFRLAALENNKAHKEFREFLLPFFSEATIKEVFPEEAFAEENENLKGNVQELQRNKQVLDALIQELSDKCSLQEEKLLETQKLQESVSDLQRQLEDYKNQNLELRKLINENIGERRMRSHSGHKNDQQDMLIRDLEHRLSFRHKSPKNGSRRDRFIDQSLEKIYKINKDIDDLAVSVKAFAGTKTDTNFLHIREMLIKNIMKLDDIASEGHIVIRTERVAVVRKAQTLLDILNSKCA